MSYKITYWDQKDGFAIVIDSNIPSRMITFWIGKKNTKYYSIYFGNIIIRQRCLIPFNHDITFLNKEEVFDFIKKKFIEANKDLISLDKISKIKLLLVTLSYDDIINVLIEVNKSGDKEYLNDIFIAIGETLKEKAKTAREQ